MSTSGTPAWMSYVSRRKLQSTATPDADKLLRKVLLRNSISRVDLALAEEAQALPQSNSTPFPQQQHPHLNQVQADPEGASASPSTPPTRLDEDEFVFPDATSLNTPRVYSTADADAEARWLDSLLEDMSDDEEANGVHDEEDDEEEEEDEEYLESLAWLLDEPQTPSKARDPLLRPFDYPLPDEDDDDLSTTPDMEDDVEGESEADSVEWPLTPGQRSMTSMLGRSITASTLNQLVASGEDAAPLPLPLPSITEGTVFEEDVRPAIHEDEPRLYRYSPAPGERPIGTSTTAFNSSVC